ncbi:MAG: SLC13/DASS family transporter [Alistipes sp.]|nr:SLC13/DASS family transporter [Candidatus Alistipes equi]
MTWQVIFTLSVIIGTFLTLLLTKIKAEYVFFFAMALLCVSGVLSFEESFKGFDSSSVLTIGVLYIVIAGLKYSGALEWIVRHIMGLPKTHARALLKMMLPVGILSSCMSNTACTALFQSVVRLWSNKLHIASSLLLIPLAYAASLGGLLTLIGTPPNLIISSMYAERVAVDFPQKIVHMNIFEPLPVGGIVFILCVGIVILLRNFLPIRTQRSVLTDENNVLSTDVKSSRKTFLSLGILIIMLGTSACGILPLHTCCLCAGILMVFLKCCTADEAFDEIDWRVIIIFAGSICFGTALTKCGIDTMIARKLLLLGKMSPYTTLLVICATAAITTEFLSDTGCAGIFFPIAYAAAMELGVDPKPFMIALMLSVSSSYATPVATPPNMIVYKVGEYKFQDFARLGIALKVISLLVCVYITPLIYSF